MTYIYVDVLLLVNLYVNYFLLRATGKMMHRSLKTARCILAAAVGSLYALTIFLPSLHWSLCLLGKGLAAVSIVWLCMGRRMRAKDVGCFFLLSFVFSGGMLAVSLLLHPSGMAVNNASLYLDVSLVSLVLCTIGAYGLICAVRRVLDRSSLSDGRYAVTIRQKTHVVKLDALADTGNALVDSFSGKSVIVCSREQLGALVSAPSNLSSDADEEALSHLHGFRLIPYTTISQSGVLPVFTPDEVVIEEVSSRQRKQVDVLIGVQPGAHSAIFNPKLLI